MLLSEWLNVERTTARALEAAIFSVDSFRITLARRDVRRAEQYYLVYF